MFRCDWCKKLSPSGQAERLVVTKWRSKTYESKKLDPLPGTSNARWTKAGVGYEADEVKRAGPCCDVKSAPVPARESFNASVPRDVASAVMRAASSMGV